MHVVVIVIIIIYIVTIDINIFIKFINDIIIDFILITNILIIEFFKLNTNLNFVCSNNNSIYNKSNITYFLAILIDKY